MAFNNYLEDENDKPYFTTNSLAYYYDKMEGFAKAVDGSAKALNLTKEEIEQRIALRLAEWDKNLESFDGSVEKLLTEWVDDGTLTHVIDSTLIDQRLAPVSTQLTELDQKIGMIKDGKPSGVFNTLAELQTAFPTGDGTNFYIVLADNKWYYWKGTSWNPGAVYQSEGIGVNGVTATNINSSSRTVNVFNKNNVKTGFYYAAVGQPIAYTVGSTWWSSESPIPVVPGDVVRFNLGFQTSYYVGVDDAGTVVQTVAAATTAGPKTVTVESGVTKFYTAVFNTHLNTTMITINNPMPLVYTPYEQLKALDWLTYKPKSIGLSALTEETVATLTSSNTSKWKDKKFISLGNSIAWQDGKIYSGTSTVARGYQTLLKEQLGFSSYLNVGVSGRSMADGTANGVGTVTTGLAQTYSEYDLVLIDEATNSLKLNVPLGTLKPVGDATFDRTTYYGAYQTLIEFILNQKPDITLVLLTPLQRNQGGFDNVTRNTAGHNLLDYVKAVEELRALYGTGLADMYRNSGFNKLTLPTYTSDLLHPIDPGYARMAGVLIGTVSSL